MAPTPTRRSGRKRHRTKYSLDAFEGIEGLSDATPSETGSRTKDPSDVASGEDEEFNLEAAHAEEVSAEDEVPSVSDDASISDADLEDDSDTRPSSRRRGRGKGKEKVKGIVNKEPGLRKTTLQSLAATPQAVRRSAADFHKFSSKQDRYISLYGSNPADLICFIRGRDKWASIAIFPVREPDSKGSGGLGHSFYHPEDVRAREATRDWEWYHNHGGEASFLQRQRSRRLHQQEGLPFVPNPPEESYKFLMGPREKQTLWSLRTRECVKVADVWAAAEQGHPGREAAARQRGGWILNAGAKVECLGWAPNHTGSVQYLALSTEIDRDGSKASEQLPRSGPATAPAFATSSPSPSSIQIWAFSSSVEGRVDVSKEPKLALVLCSLWGEVRQLRWCPAVRDASEMVDNETISIGLLGAVYCDGKLRVLDVRLRHDWDSPTEYMHLDQAAFTCGPPDTICTCVDWLSSSHIAAGCANGFVAIWDMSAHLQSPATAPASSPRPFFYHLLHQTYILALSSCYPSHPSLIITSAMDGYIRLTSTHAPLTDTVLAPRSRIGPSALAWSDAIQCVLAAEENSTVRAYAVRRLFTGIAVARPVGTVSSLCVGTAHPTLLSGSADGAAMATNPMRRILKDRHKVRGYQQLWFRHEWSSGPTGEADKHPRGISRFTEGYVLESPNLFRSFGDDNRLPDQAEKVLPTVFEKGTAVTAVCWNPNIACAGWAAAGMASGLVRVEDLAL